MGVYEGIVALIFAGWFIVSVLNQFRFGWFNRIRRADRFSLLPAWTFFAPNPGQSDYHLVYRDRRADGSLTGWREVPITVPRKPYSFIWNPWKRSRKVLSDMVGTVISASRANPQLGDEIMLSIPYLVLLNVVCHFDTSPDATHRQFLLVETFGFRPTALPQIILRSDFHALAGGSGL
jgi:hypothetical protein